MTKVVWTSGPGYKNKTAQLQKAIVTKQHFSKKKIIDLLI